MEEQSESHPMIRSSSASVIYGQRTTPENVIVTSWQTPLPDPNVASVVMERIAATGAHSGSPSSMSFASDSLSESTWVPDIGSLHGASPSPSNVSRMNQMCSQEQSSHEAPAPERTSSSSTAEPAPVETRSFPLCSRYNFAPWNQQPQLPVMVGQARIPEGASSSLSPVAVGVGRFSTEAPSALRTARHTTARPSVIQMSPAVGYASGSSQPGRRCPALSQAQQDVRPEALSMSASLNPSSTRSRQAIQEYLRTMHRVPLVQAFGSRDTDPMLAGNSLVRSCHGAAPTPAPLLTSAHATGRSSASLFSRPPTFVGTAGAPLAGRDSRAGLVDWHETPFAPLVHPDGRPAGHHNPIMPHLQHPSRFSQSGPSHYTSTSELPFFESTPSRNHTVHWFANSPPIMDSEPAHPPGVQYASPASQDDMSLHNAGGAVAVTRPRGHRSALPYARPSVSTSNDNFSIVVTRSTAALPRGSTSVTSDAATSSLMAAHHRLMRDQQRADTLGLGEFRRRAHQEIAGGEMVAGEQPVHSHFVTSSPSYQQRLRALQDNNSEQRRRLVYVPREAGHEYGRMAASLLQYLDATAIYMQDGEPKLILEEDVIAAIAMDTRSFKFENQFPHNDECIICFEEYELQQDVRVLSCSHTHRFHQHCIDKWLIKNKPNCPICRQILPSLNPRKDPVPNDHPMDDMSAAGPSTMPSLVDPDDSMNTLVQMLL